jgi:hypothetical protein
MEGIYKLARFKNEPAYSSSLVLNLPKVRAHHFGKSVWGVISVAQREGISLPLEGFPEGVPSEITSFLKRYTNMYGYGGTI